MKKPFILSLLLSAYAIGESQTDPGAPFSRTVDWSQDRVEAARQELNATRERIADEQTPLLKLLTTVQSEVTLLRRDQKRLLFEGEEAKHTIERLAGEVRSLTTQQSSVRNRFLHLRREFEENLPSIERSRFSETFLSVENNDTETTFGRLSQLKALFAVAESAIDRIDDQIGGHRYPASALVDGVVASGMALQIGPYVFFAPEDGDPGLIVDSGDLTGELRRRNSGTSKAVAACVAGAEGLLPFDPLLDQAFLISDAKVSLWGHIRSGGLWVIPIMAFGLLSAVLALRKIIQIRGIRAPENAEVVGMVDAIDDAEFARGLEAITPHARPVFTEGHSYRTAPESARTAAMSQALLSFRVRIESGLSLIGLTAAVAPLLGLLGTVTGMIKTFQVISLHGAGDARALSGGISEALVTTELGLVVAIPALLAHAWLSRRARRISIQTAVLADRYNKTLPSNRESI